MQNYARSYDAYSNTNIASYLVLNIKVALTVLVKFY